MRIFIRKTSHQDYFTTENLTREAFWNLYSPGCNEHLILHQLRKSKSYIPELDLIAIHDSMVIGHVISTKARVIDENTNEYEVLCVGPVSVLPELQNKGIGTKLLEHSIIVARKLDYQGMLLFGNPDFYSRFGFVNAEVYDISTKEGKNLDPFMALELSNNSLAGVKGKFFEDEAYMTDNERLKKFEKKFPAKKKRKPKIDLSDFTK